MLTERPVRLLTQRAQREAARMPARGGATAARPAPADPRRGLATRAALLFASRRAR
jgi:hypothetical protein